MLSCERYFIKGIGWKVVEHARAACYGKSQNMLLPQHHCLLQQKTHPGILDSNKLTQELVYAVQEVLFSFHSLFNTKEMSNFEIPENSLSDVPLQKKAQLWFSPWLSGLRQPEEGLLGIPRPQTSTEPLFPSPGLCRGGTLQQRGEGCLLNVLNTYLPVYWSEYWSEMLFIFS